MFNSFHSVFFDFALLFLKSAFESLFWIPFCFSQFDITTCISILSHLFILFLTFSSYSARQRGRGGRGRRPEIDVGPAHTETGSWLNRSDRSGTEHLLCQTAGPLWMEIISKLLQEADACQKMLSVKVRLLQCCLALAFPLSLPLSHFCFLHLLKFVYFPSFYLSPFLSLLQGFFCNFTDPALLFYIMSLSFVQCVVPLTGDMFSTL